jgi:hypothetical protein
MGADGTEVRLREVARELIRRNLMVKHTNIFQGVHLWQVLWLDDERAVDLLIDLLDRRDSPAKSMTLAS